ncbi:PD40 domain-containing protein [bacterium]|nr:PD40 domain-containing protein [bacterium]
MSELILFSAKAGNYYRIYTVRPDGRDLQPVLNLRRNCREPNLCAVNNEIVFSMFSDGSWNLYKTDLRGAYIERLTDSIHTDRHPVWSPDGETIVFETDRWGAGELACIDKNGENLRRLTNSGVSNSFPVWSPDGKKLAFVSWRNGSPDIFTMNMPERELHPVTKKYLACFNPCWFADSENILFLGKSYKGYFVGKAGGGKSIHKYALDVKDVSCAALSPDGTRLLVSKVSKDGNSLLTADLETEEWSEFPAQIPAAVCDAVWQRKTRTWD